MRADACDVVIVGGAGIDFSARGSRLPRAGESAEGESFHSGPGGKGANAAVAAARLGCHVSLVTRVGSDVRGDSVLEHLAAEGVETRHVTRDAEAPTAVTVIQVDGKGRKQTLSRPGAVQRVSVSDVRAAAESISRAGALLVQLEVPVSTVIEAVSIARKHRVKIVLDPAPPRSLPDSLLLEVDLICPNAKEAEVLVGIDVHDRDSARKACEWLLGRGVGATAMEAGSEGKLLVWPGGECWLPRIPVDVIDTTGSGDTFAAAAAACLAKGATLEELGPFANAAAALATTALGAQSSLPSDQDVRGLLARHLPTARHA